MVRTKYLRYIFLLGFLIPAFSNSQNFIKRNTFKTQKFIITKPDTLTVISGNVAKFDTLYIRNLTDKGPEDKSLETWLPVLTAFLGGALAILGQYLIKRIENKGQRKTSINSKSLDHLENIANKISSLSLISPQDSQSILTGADDLRSYCFQNNLYVDKEYEKIVNQIGDYYSTVARNPTQKNIQKEDLLWIQFKKLFNK